MDVYDDPGVIEWLLRTGVMAGERELLKIASDYGAKRVVDVGSGPGRLAPFCRSLGLAYVAIDPHESNIATIRSRIPDVEAAVGWGSKIPLSDGNADFALLAYHVIEAIRPSEERYRTLRDVHRVLRPGGLLMISYHVRWRRRAARMVAFKLQNARSEFGDLVMNPHAIGPHVDRESAVMHIPSRGEVRALAKACGFERIESRSLRSGAARANSLLASARIELWRATDSAL